MKFGGTSVGGASAIAQVVEIVRSQQARRPVVVVSAHAGVTDALLAAARTAAAGGEADSEVHAIATRHRTILAGLELPEDLLDPLLDDLRDLARGVRLVGAAGPKAVDALLSFGERLSARVVAAALRGRDVPAQAVDAFDAGLRTDSSFGRARPLPDDGRIARHLAAIDGVPVVTGFLGADADGNVTTLGRNGSDYSAALFGAAVAAEQIQVWKDVDGVHTADPRIVPEARPIRRMSFDDVADLASFGSKVLHPAAMVPAMQCGIPLQVRNTMSPDDVGTTIEATPPADRPTVRAIAHRDRVALVTVTSERLLPQHAFLARLFNGLHELECDVGPVAVGEAAVTVAVPFDVHTAVADRLAGLGHCTVAPECSVVGVLGDAETLEHGGIADVLSELGRAHVRLRCAGLGARGSTVAFAVESARMTDAVRLLHNRFFAS